MKKKKPGPKRGSKLTQLIDGVSHRTTRTKPPMHEEGARLLRLAQLIDGVAQSITSAKSRLKTLQLEEIASLERTRESLQAALNMHQLTLQMLREEIEKRDRDPALEEKAQLYIKVMGALDRANELTKPGTTWTLRQWDGGDGCWTDVIVDAKAAEALHLWCHNTGNGTHHTKFEEMDYYKIFPGGARMIWDGREDGGEAFR